jgi:prevent-host-death family protein
VTTIPQRELRNNVSDVLRRAESGEHFTITVDGRAVAELGPVARPRRLARAPRLGEVLADTPVDAGWTAELEHARDEDREAARDPWAK